MLFQAARISEDEGENGQMINIGYRFQGMYIFRDINAKLSTVDTKMCLPMQT